MGKKSKWRKICGIGKNESCFNCANRISIMENKENIIVECKLNDNVRTLNFNRHISPVPYCGAYKV